jgi:large subunit ribosomal protein L31
VFLGQTGQQGAPTGWISSGISGFSAALYGCFGRSACGLADWTPNHPAPVHVISSIRRPGGHHEGIHPEYVLTQVTCSCGNSFTTRSTAKSGELHADVCSACHPFYTGKQKIMDVGGRVDKFEKRFGKRVRNS